MATAEADEPEQKSEITTIALTRSTKKRLDSYGHKNQTHDELVNQLLNKIESLETTVERMGTDR